MTHSVLPDHAAIFHLDLLADALLACFGGVITRAALIESCEAVDAARLSVEQLHYEHKLAMLDRCVVTLGAEQSRLARRLRAQTLLQRERLEQQHASSRLLHMVMEAGALTMLHGEPALISPALLAQLPTLEREVALALRDRAEPLLALCARLDLPLERLRRAHARAITQLAALC